MKWGHFYLVLTNLKVWMMVKTWKLTEMMCVRACVRILDALNLYSRFKYLKQRQIIHNVAFNRLFYLRAAAGRARCGCMLSRCFTNYPSTNTLIYRWHRHDSIWLIRLPAIRTQSGVNRQQTLPTEFKVLYSIYCLPTEIHPRNLNLFVWTHCAFPSA